MRAIKKIFMGLTTTIAVIALAGCGAPQALDKTVDACNSKNATLDKVDFYKDGDAGGSLGKIYEGDTLLVMTYDDPEMSPALQCVREKLPLSDEDYQKLLKADSKTHRGTMSGYKAIWGNSGMEYGLRLALTKTK